WCGPCKTLGPIIERVVDGSEGRVELAKVDIDENPRVGATFRVQSIPAVFAIRDRQVVDHFIGAVPEAAVRAFVESLAPPVSPADKLVALGTEDALRAALDLEPDHVDAITRLAELLVAQGSPDATAEALALLARIPETADTRRIAALARAGAAAGGPSPEIEHELDALLEQVKSDDEARQRYLDLLEVLGPDDPRTGHYRRALTSRLF
ncbi:MAG TPA: tetratricopeptide repeat protein, partial [Solirubrobacteraceae bacterium]